MELPASTCTEPAFTVAPAPCQVPFTCAELLTLCSTRLEFPVTTSAPVTVSVDPPPSVRVAPFAMVKPGNVMLLPAGNVVSWLR